MAGVPDEDDSCDEPIIIHLRPPRSILSPEFDAYFSDEDENVQLPSKYLYPPGLDSPYLYPPGLPSPYLYAPRTPSPDLHPTVDDFPIPPSPVYVPYEEEVEKKTVPWWVPADDDYSDEARSRLPFWHQDWKRMEAKKEEEIFQKDIQEIWDAFLNQPDSGRVTKPMRLRYLKIQSSPYFPLCDRRAIFHSLKYGGYLNIARDEPINKGKRELHVLQRVKEMEETINDFTAKKIIEDKERLEQDKEKQKQLRWSNPAWMTFDDFFEQDTYLNRHKYAAMDEAEKRSKEKKAEELRRKSEIYSRNRRRDELLRSCAGIRSLSVYGSRYVPELTPRQKVLREEVINRENQLQEKICKQEKKIAKWDAIIREHNSQDKADHKLQHDIRSLKWAIESCRGKIETLQNSKVELEGKEKEIAEQTRVLEKENRKMDYWLPKMKEQKDIYQAEIQELMKQELDERRTLREEQEKITHENFETKMNAEKVRRAIRHWKIKLQERLKQLSFVEKKLKIQRQPPPPVGTPCKE